jgi:hypothetical protein
MMRNLLLIIALFLSLFTSCATYKTIEGNVAKVNTEIPENHHFPHKTVIRYDDGRSIRLVGVIPVPITGKYSKITYLLDDEGDELFTEVLVDGQTHNGAK